MKEQRNKALMFALIVAAATALSGACKRAATTGATGTTSAANEAVLDGCLEINPKAEKEKAAACQACLKKNAINGPGKDGCCGLGDAVGLQLCQVASACMFEGGPPVGTCNVAGDTSTCFCGKHQADCEGANKANGPCVAQIAAAAGRNVDSKTTDTPTAAQILERYGDVKYALGRATNIAAIAGALCKTECGLGM